jgi:spore coat protein U-like protein
MAPLRAYIIIAFLLSTASLSFAASATGSLTVSAYITSMGRCTLTSTTNIAFGSLYPLNPVDVEASGSVVVRCWRGGRRPNSSNTFTVGVTQVTSSPLTLKNSTNSSNTITYTLPDLPASVTGSTSNANIVDLTIPITAKIQGTAYQTAPAGSYSGTVTLEISP